MGLSIVKYPKEVVNANAATVSKWNALHHPIGFQYQRQDRAIQSSAFFTSSIITVQLYGTVEGVVGDTVYFKSGANTGVGTIQAILYSGYTSIIRINYVASTTITQLGGYLNFNTARKNYNTITNILAVDEFGAYYVLGQSINKPDYTGLIKVDVSTYLKALVNYFDTFGYNVMNWKDDTLGGRFNIVYSENWTGTGGDFSGVSTTALYYYTNGTKQIQEIYGSNYGDFVPFKEYATDDIRAKFLCDFEIPTYFQGFPFDLGFIYSESIATVPVLKKEEDLDANGDVVGSSSYTLDPTQALGVNRMKVDEGYASQIKRIRTWLEITVGGVITLPYVSVGYVATGYVASPASPTPVVVTPVIYGGVIR